MTDTTSIVPWAAGGSAMLLLTVAISLILRQVGSLLRENRRCNRRLGILFRVVLANKLDIPANYWDEVQTAVAEPLPPRDRHARG